MADHDARIYELTGGLCPIVLTRDWKDSAVERPREWKFGPAVVVNRPDIVVKQWQSSGTLIVPLDPLPIITWTDQEYSDLLSDPDWTLEETTTLFDLAGAFDLRFTLIHDRYPEDWPPKTIEQMQHRYYSVNRILLTARLPRDDPNTRIEIEKYNYNLTMQEMRKANLEALLARPAELIKVIILLHRKRSCWSGSFVNLKYQVRNG